MENRSLRNLTVYQIRYTPVDLQFTPEQESLRAEVRAWLEDNAPREPLPSLDTREGFAAHREWERALFAARLSAVHWPREYGGRDLGLVEWLVFEEEYWGFGAPNRVNQNGIYLLGPTLLEHGTPEQKARFLPKIASSEEVWCQGWSEPDSGSDLASLRATATRDGDEWVLNGQKTWCSRGAFADWMFGLFRSDPRSERHHGLTYVLVPLDAPGVTVRPIAQLDGEAGFAEVFLDDARVPVANTLGPIGAGWKVAMSTAGFERGVILRSPGRFAATARRLIDLYAHVGAPSHLRDDVVQSWMDAEAYKLQTLWTVSKLLDDSPIGPEASVNKVFWSEMDLAMHETALRLLGERAPLASGAPAAVDDGRWLDGFLFALAGPIYAGTNEIQRNIIAERVLGLPRKA
jgi:alkylation response protein AidB-like acyl-CoA dehydrogenase